MVTRCDGKFLAHTMEKVNATLIIVQDFGFVLIWIKILHWFIIIIIIIYCALVMLNYNIGAWDLVVSL
jgi:hypothetical protein